MVMASAASGFLSLGLICFLFLFHGCASLGLETLTGDQVLWQSQSLQQAVQQRRLRAKTECRVERLNAREPNRRFSSEAGEIEFWDPNSEEMVCAGVEVVRNTVHPRGLLLPHYTNVPQLVYIVQGRGVQGVVIPGCAETYEGQSTGGDRKRRFPDRHQKIRAVKEGDVIALPAGAAIWFYNDGEVPAVSVSLLDTSNPANQLENNFRSFFLAGNRQQGEGQYQQEQEGQRGEGQRGQQYSSSNIFNGFDDQMLANAFNVEVETIRNLKGENDQRGRIVRAERLHLTAPRWEEEEEMRQQDGNGLEETICSMKLRENIGHPANSQVYNPRGGRISTVNSLRLPILSWLQLSAERGVLYRNAIMAPHWNQLAHSIIYVSGGNGRIQVVDNNGVSVFDDQVQEGQLLIVPQNFAVIKRASQQGLEWVSFKTNEFATSTQLAGRVSAIRAIPEEVLATSYGISREDARSLKYNRQEFAVFSPGSRSTRE